MTDHTEAEFTAWTDREFGPSPDPARLPQTERFSSYFKCFKEARATQASAPADALAAIDKIEKQVGKEIICCGCFVEGHPGDGYFQPPDPPTCCQQPDEDVAMLCATIRAHLRAPAVVSQQLTAEASGAAPPAQQWLPIEDAPKDGSLVLLCTDGGIVFVGKFRKHLFIWVDDEGRERFRTVKWFQPLPPAPQHQGGGNG